MFRALVISAGLIGSALALSGCATLQKDVQQYAPIISKDIATACTLADGWIDASPVLQGTCSVNGMIQATIKDTLPITATNSGNTAAWIAQTVADAKTQSGK